MKKQILSFVAFAMLAISGEIAAQVTYTQQLKPADWKCGSNRLLENSLALGGAAVNATFNNFNSQVNMIINSSSSMSPPSAPYTIPVVFHVIGDATFTNIPVPTYAQIQWQLATLNAAFSNSLASLNGAATGTQAVNTQIQFCLAKNMELNPGQASPMGGNPGMVVYTTTNTALISNVVMNNTLSLQALAAITNYTAWYPPSKYLNIFCVPNITNLLSGYSISDPPSIIGIGTFPWANMAIDGIIMRSDCIGNNTYNNFPMFSYLDKGNILVHEVGHYLGLFHTFETITSGLNTANGTPGCYGTSALTAYINGDLVYDTPPTLINNAIGTGPINTCAETYTPYGLASDENDQLENFMTYSDDGMMNTFTLNQAERMWAALDASQPPATYLSSQRSNLVTPSNLAFTGVTTAPACGPCIATAAFNSSLIASSISCSTAAFQFIVPVLPTYICPTTYSWNFGDGGTSTSVNPIHTFTNTSLLYTVQLTATQGTTALTYSTVVNIPNGFPKIVGQSGNGMPVCRGTEQTILIQFPAYSTSAVLTDGTNFYTVNNNATHTCLSPAGIYKYPFIVTVNSNVSFSMVPANCGTLSAGVASFTVVDCCTNLVTNGDFENGVTGYYSNYTLSPTSGSSGFARINFPLFVSIGNTGKALTVDSYAWTTFGCPSPGSSSLIIGQGITGLKPNTNYYVSLKTSQSHDSITNACTKPAKFNVRVSDAGGNLLNKNFVPSTVPPSFGAGSCLSPLSLAIQGALQVVNFTFATSGTVTPLTSFSLELREVDQSSGSGFDDLFDNLILAEMNPPIQITPGNATVCANSTVQLNAANNCVNINNYSLTWFPPAGVSCSTCPNPVVSPSVTTIYTLIAIPPITNPPTANIIVTVAVNVSDPHIVALSSPTAPCFPSATFTLLATGVSSATWMPGNLATMSIVVNPVTPTIYTLNSTNANCLQNNTISIGPFSMSTTSLVSYCANLNPSVVISATSPNSSWATYTWQPGNLTGSSQTVSPSSSTVYTVTGALGSCSVSATVSVTVLNNCCPSGWPTFTQTSVSSTTVLFGPMNISSDFTIQPGVSFGMSGNFIMSSNAKMTVNNTAEVYIDGAYMHSCGSSMWKGIYVKDGGQVQFFNSGNSDNLVEDAITAVEINQTSSTPTAVLVALNTTFNKNYIDIKLSGYNHTTTPYPFAIENCVFTCRDLHLPANTTVWPQTGTVSSASNYSADLRHAFASTPTTGLASPYLNQSTFSITTLKSPYSGQPSHIAIQINNVGVTSGTTMYGAAIGTTYTSRFNVFDAHGYFISTLNSHLTSVNNIFQNTLTYTVSNIAYGGVAVSHSTSSVFNTELQMPAANKSTGNRFWNCHKGIEGKNIFRIWIENATFRSTQNSANVGFYPGNTGIFIATNRFQYYIANNEFTNIETGINIPLSAGAFTQAGTSFTIGYPGVYADRLRIPYNSFTGSVNGVPGSYMNDGVIITEPLVIPWYAVINNSVTPVVNAVAVNSNTFSQVFRAINVNGVRGFPTLIDGNQVLLKDGGSSFGIQHGIRLTNCNPTGVIGGYYGKSSVSLNTLRFFTQPLNTGTVNAMIWCGQNGYSLLSPSITCNTLEQGSQGFVFEGSSPGTIWAANNMKSLDAGMVLLNNGKIGQQGASALTYGNLWNGSWSGSNHTYVYNSFPIQSKLFVNMGTPGQPMTNLAQAPGQDYGQPNCIMPSNGGAYQCNGIPNNKVVPIPNNVGGLLSAEAFFMEKLALYQLLQLNDSVKNSSAGMQDFYNTLSGSTIDKFMQIEKFLYKGEHGNATDKINSISTVGLNGVELNYRSFYTLYSSYLKNGSLTEAQRMVLYNLAILCPGKNGACVYQAAALYNFIYKVLIYPNCSGGDKGRMANFTDLQNEQEQINETWTLALFPNPASNQITIKSNVRTEALSVMIKDISGRVVLIQNLKTSDFIANLDLSLPNGAYIIIITNSHNESISKKLLIAE